MWIIAGDVLNTQYFVIPIGNFAGFELQFTRILLLAFTLYFLYLICIRSIGRHHSTIGTRIYRYEIYLSLYFILSLVAMLFHLSRSLTLKEITVVYSGWLTFLVFYYTAKNTVDLGFVKSVFYSILCVGILSSLVSIIQFFIDPYFMRAGVGRVAFAGKLRSDGVFTAEYTQSYFLIPAIMLTLTIIKNKYRYLLMGVFLIGILLTFHRMSWIITILTITGYYLLCAPKREKIFAIGSILVLSLIMVSLMPIVLNINSDFVNDRLFSNTVSGRTTIYEVAFRRMQNTWLFGVGSVRTNVYYADILKSGEVWAATGEIGGIHNLFLNMGYFYGLPVVVSFCIFLISTVIFFAKKMYRFGTFYFVPTATIGMFILANLSNWFYLNMQVSLLLSIILGISVAVYQKRLNIHEIIVFKKNAEVL
ncbi:MAG: O-antigen ligase family protein [Candidatus Brocadia sp.]|nr:MAG: O-antigen ligase family protein [Candidatus Brocadia sp.]